MMTQVDRLRAFINDTPIGVLRAVHSEAESAAKGYVLEFSYLPEWEGMAGAYPVSPHLPLGKVSSGPSVWNYFVNLLPEGSILEDVSARLNLGRHDVFGLLLELGRDCAGAITLLPEGQTPDAAQRYQPLPVEELRRRIPPRKEGKLYALGGRLRMSLAGTQDKLGLALDDQGGFLIPEGTTPSTHIIKPECSDQFHHCVVNEFFVMRLAGLMGLNVPKTGIVRVPEPIYIVERFDRERNEDGLWKRIHQIDVCQAKNALNTRKYEQEYEYAPLGLTIKDCFDVARYDSVPGQAIMQTIRWTVFNYLVGNTDAHAKNMSILIRPDSIRLAPFYDLLCVRAYGEDYNRLAFCIGGEDNIDWIDEACWRKFAKDCSLNERLVLTTLRSMAEAIVPNAQGLMHGEDFRLLTDDERESLETIAHVIERHSLLAQGRDPDADKQEGPSPG